MCNGAEPQPCKVRGVMDVGAGRGRRIVKAVTAAALGPAAQSRGKFCVVQKSPRDLDTKQVLIGRGAGPETLHFPQAPRRCRCCWPTHGTWSHRALQ